MWRLSGTCVNLLCELAVWTCWRSSDRGLQVWAVGGTVMVGRGSEGEVLWDSCFHPGYLHCCAEEPSPAALCHGRAVAGTFSQYPHLQPFLIPAPYPNSPFPARNLSRTRWEKQMLSLPAAPSSHMQIAVYCSVFHQITLCHHFASPWNLLKPLVHWSVNPPSSNADIQFKNIRSWSSRQNTMLGSGCCPKAQTLQWLLNKIPFTD